MSLQCASAAAYLLYVAYAVMSQNIKIAHSLSEKKLFTTKTIEIWYDALIENLNSLLYTPHYNKRINVIHFDCQ